MQTNNDPTNSPHPQDAERRQRAEATWWQALGTLYRWRRFVIGMTGAVAVLAVVISLLLPDWYKASTRVILPNQGGSGLLSGLSSDISSAASSLLTGPSGDYLRYLSIVSSRTVRERAVDEFDLVDVYETGDAEAPREEAIKILADNVEFVIDDEYEFLSVEVLDKDPQRAADLANFMVDELDRLNTRLASGSAATFRRYVEQRYHEAQAALDSLLDRNRAFQEEYGVYDLPAQAEGFFEYLAELRANALRAEIQYETFQDQFGASNAQVRMYQDLARSANQKYEDALAGREQLLPVARGEVPEVARQYADIQRALTVQSRILEIVAPVYEQARFDEERQREAVQVVDPAVPPVEKAYPLRMVIVVASTLSAFILVVVFVLVYEWWQRNYATFAHRLQEAAGEPSVASSSSTQTAVSEPTESAQR